jgi:hypothetical protein
MPVKTKFINIFSGDVAAIVSVTLRASATHERDTITVRDRMVARLYFDAYRALPSEHFEVKAFYPAINQTAILNYGNSKGTTPMDLSHIYAERQISQVSTNRRLVAPEPNVIPVDGSVSFIVVETIRDIIDAPKSAILLFPSDKFELLQCIVDYADQFDFVPYVLSGLPSADYDQQFESRTFTLERVSYTSLVNELLETARIQKSLAASQETVFEKEKKQYTRSSGSVKELSNVRVAGKPDDVEPSDSSLEL